MVDFRPEFRFSSQIWTILLGFGLFGRIWVRIGPKEDEALWMGQGRGLDEIEIKT